MYCSQIIRKKPFLTNQIGCDEDEINESTDIFNDLGCYGDDFHEMIDKYSKTFKVGMTNYLWYFHTIEEGQNIGGIFIKSPDQRVQRIKVTPKLSLEFANEHKWDVVYPEHEIPKRRYCRLPRSSTI